MKSIVHKFLIFIAFFGNIVCNGQYYENLSPNRIDYQVTFDTIQHQYTVWVVPLYSTPNSYNTGIDEKGDIAQVTIAVPTQFLIASITDVNGIWEKSPIKWGPGIQGQNWSKYKLPANEHYYVIGKTASETNYRQFTINKPIPLFKFVGNGCYGTVRIIEFDEPIIAAADQIYSLNFGNSFYSRSGQPSGGNQVPWEQFYGVAGSPASCKTISACVAIKCVPIQAGIVVVK